MAYFLEVPVVTRQASHLKIFYGVYLTCLFPLSALYMHLGRLPPSEAAIAIQE